MSYMLFKNGLTDSHDSENLAMKIVSFVITPSLGE